MKLYPLMIHRFLQSPSLLWKLAESYHADNTADRWDFSRRVLQIPVRLQNVTYHCNRYHPQKVLCTTCARWYENFSEERIVVTQCRNCCSSPMREFNIRTTSADRHYIYPAYYLDFFNNLVYHALTLQEKEELDERLQKDGWTTYIR